MPCGGIKRKSIPRADRSLLYQSQSHQHRRPIFYFLQKTTSSFKKNSTVRVLRKPPFASILTRRIRVLLCTCNCRRTSGSRNNSDRRSASPSTTHLHPQHSRDGPPVISRFPSGNSLALDALCIQSPSSSVPALKKSQSLACSYILSPTSPFLLHILERPGTEESSYPQTLGYNDEEVGLRRDVAPLRPGFVQECGCQGRID